MTHDLENLAKHVQQRREELDLTQLDLRALGGPSNSTLTQIEAARPPTPSRATLHKLDKGLRWEPGSARQVLSGGEPAPLNETAASDPVYSAVYQSGLTRARQHELLALYERLRSEQDLSELPTMRATPTLRTPLPPQEDIPPGPHADTGEEPSR